MTILKIATWMTTVILMMTILVVNSLKWTSFPIC